MRLKLILLLGFILHSSSHAYSFEQLPLDESNVSEYLSNGLLDSATWNLVKQFYVQKVFVSQNELKILQGLFPDLISQSVIDSLNSYEPWTDSTIEKFYNDHPELVYFEPILSFDSPQMRHLGLVAFTYYKMNSSEASQRLRFTFREEKYFALTGRAELTDKYSRWNQRLLSFKPVPSIAVELGNYSLQFDNNLFYGKFSELSTKSSVRDNWITGGINSWNGVAISLSRSSGVDGLSKVTTFYHKAGDELGGVLGSFRKSNASLMLGVTGGIHEDSIEKDTMVYLHCKSSYITSLWKIELISGLNPSDLKIPLLFSADITKDKNRAGLRLLVFPHGSRFTMSRSFQKLTTRVPFASKLSNNTLLTMSDMKIAYAHRYNNVVHLNTAIQGTFYGTNLCAVMSEIGVQGSVPAFTYHMNYQYNPLSSIDDSSLYSITFSSSIFPKENVSCAITTNLQYHTRSLPMFISRCEIPIKRDSLFTFNPFLTCHYDRFDKAYTFTTGFEQKMYLFKRTFSQILFEKPLYNEEIRFKGEISFLL